MTAESSSLASPTPGRSTRTTGSELAWEDLEARFTRRLHSYFRRLPCSRADRQELVLDVLAEVFVASSELSNSEQVARDIERTARRKARMWMRVRRHEIQPFSISHEAATSPRTGLERRSFDLGHYLELLLRSIPPAQRAALERHVLDDQDDLTIARAVGCSVNSVRVLRHRAKSRLRLLVSRGALPPPPDIGDDS